MLEQPDGTPDPTYGSHLQQIAAHGVAPEGRLAITHEPGPKFELDGTEVQLTHPRYQITDLGYGPLHPDTALSVRLAPPIAGLGLLALIDDRPPDQARFGWRADRTSLREQTVLAFHQDLGVTTSDHPNPNCTPTQTACLTATSPRPEPDMDDQRLDELMTYIETLLPPPPRRPTDDAVRRGEQDFLQAGCADCHTPTHTVPADTPSGTTRHVIAPYTDLQLHDLGNGLADDPDNPNASRLWRTPPLWGLGWRGTNDRPAAYLHDGRAPNLTEAILWHDGEATTARTAFIELTTEARADLLLFLESL